MNTIEVPSSRSCRMMPMSSSVSCGVRTAVGSSNTSTLASREGLDDLDALLHAHGQVADEGVGVDLEAKALRDVAHVLAGRVQIESAEGLGVLVAEHDVLGHGEDGDEHEVLVHHADSRGHGVARAAETLDDVVQEDLASSAWYRP